MAVSGAGGSQSSSRSNTQSSASRSTGVTKNGSMTVGARGAAVSKVQSALGARGFSVGAVDGKFGPKTKAAVEAFQRQLGLSVDGMVGKRTSSALGTRVDGFDGPTAKARTATIERITTTPFGKMASGKITINGHTYSFNSGGRKKGRDYLPKGTYTATSHRYSRTDKKSMMVGGVGYSFALSDKFDPRLGRMRGDLRIHPDGLAPGTEGCIGIVGNAAVQRQFRDDMQRELDRSGGRVSLRVE